MKKRDERERDRAREIGYAASALWSRQPLSMHLSIHPLHTASSPLWSPPTPVLRLHAPSLTCSLFRSLSLSIMPREKSREGQRWKEGEEIQSGASQGGPIERIRQGRRVRGTEQRDNSQGHRERENLRCLIYSLSCCRQICEFGERQIYGEKQTEGRT